MTFETTNLLLNWMEMGGLLAILFRLSSTFDLIANTQRELRRGSGHSRRVSGHASRRLTPARDLRNDFIGQWLAPGDLLD